MTRRTTANGLIISSSKSRAVKFFEFSSCAAPPAAVVVKMPARQMRQSLDRVAFLPKKEEGARYSKMNLTLNCNKVTF